jgi:hypothetical protein
VSLNSEFGVGGGVVVVWWCSGVVVEASRDGQPCNFIRVHVLSRPLEVFLSS